MAQWAGTVGWHSAAALSHLRGVSRLDQIEVVVFEQPVALLLRLSQYLAHLLRDQLRDLHPVCRPETGVGSESHAEASFGGQGICLRAAFGRPP